MKKTFFMLLIAGVFTQASAQTQQIQGLLLGDKGIDIGWRHIFIESPIAYNTLRIGGKYESLIGGISYTNTSVVGKYSIDQVGVDLGCKIPFSSHIGLLLNVGYNLWSEQYSSGKIYTFGQPSLQLSLYGSFEPTKNFFIKPAIGLGYRATLHEGKGSYTELPFLLGVGIQIPVQKRAYVTFMPMLESVRYYGLLPQNYFSTTLGFNYNF